MEMIEMDGNTKWSYFTIGLGIGIIGGLSISFLLTPNPGKQSRAFIGDKINDFSGTIKEATANREKLYKEAWKKPKTKPYDSEFSQVK